MTARTTTATARQAVDAGACGIRLTATATAAAVATGCTLTSKLVGHEGVNVTWQLIAARRAIIASVVVAIIAFVETV